MFGIGGGFGSTPDRNAKAAKDFDFFGGGSAKPNSARRGSVGGNFEVDSAAGGTRRGGGDANQPAEPPVLSTTLKALQLAVASANIGGGKIRLYDNIDCGAVVLLGWVASPPVTLGELDVAFGFADGTTHEEVSISVVIRSDARRWMQRKVAERIVEGGQLRIVCTASVADGSLQLRCLHFSVPEPRDAAYFHAVETIHTYMVAARQIAPDGPDAARPEGAENFGASAESQPVNPSQDFLFTQSPNPKVAAAAGGSELAAWPESVKLPSVYDDVADVKRRTLLKFVVDNAEPDIGVAKKKIVEHFGVLLEASEVTEVIAEMEEAGNIYKTLDDCYAPIS